MCICVTDNYEKHISQHLPLKVAAELKFLTFYDKSKPFPTMKYKANQWVSKGTMCVCNDI